MVNNTKKWNAKVVYGDTDRYFVVVCLVTCLFSTFPYKEKS